MNNTQLYIPQKCKVGFNIRPDTYTGKLGYIIYNDGKVWRKETSWEGWRQKEGDIAYGGVYDEKGRWKQTQTKVTGVEPIEFENVPTSGFVLNKKAGGTNSGWNHRQTYCRVYDPRGWEFEITIPNLLFILEECSAFKGKGLEGELVYSWDGKDLVLLPVSSYDYKKCVDYTELQGGKITKKDLVEGVTYLTTKQDKFVYLGHYPVYDGQNLCPMEVENGNIEGRKSHNENRQYHSRYSRGSYPDYEEITVAKPVKKHVFKQLSEPDPDLPFYQPETIIMLSSLSRLKAKESDNIHPQFPEFVDEFQKSEYYSKAVSLEIGDIDENTKTYLKDHHYNQTVFLRREIKTIEDMKKFKKTCNHDHQSGLFNISNGDYNYRNTTFEETGLTYKEVAVKYGKMYRVFENGFKKVIY